MQKTLVVIACTTIAAFAVACKGSGGTGGSGTTGTGNGTSTSATGAGAGNCMVTVQAFCMKRDMCSMSGYENDRAFGSETNCEMREVTGCKDDAGAQGFKPGFDAKGCAAAEGSESCQDWWDGIRPAACANPGTLPNGSKCGVGTQCSTGHCDVGFDQCGTCQPAPTAGASCGGGGDDCPAGDACVKQPGGTVLTPGSCTPLVMKGGMCDGSHPCANGTDCVGATATTMGTCQSTVTMLNSACDAARKSAPSCEGTLGLVCITPMGAMMGTCQAIQLAAAGQPCGSMGTPVTSIVDCSGGAYCKKAAPTDKTGVCTASAADGAACDLDTIKGAPCLAPAKCVPTAQGQTAGTCVMPHAATCI